MLLAFLIATLVFLAIMSFAYWLIKDIYLDLIDKVYDEGSTILFVNAKEEVRVNIKDINEISYDWRHQQVTIVVKHNTKFGNVLKFMSSMTFIPFKKHKNIVSLIDRIYKPN